VVFVGEKTDWCAVLWAERRHWFLLDIVFLDLGFSLGKNKEKEGAQARVPVLPNMA
jgi:hypothetical protein